MSTKSYNQKRDFRSTPEPKARSSARSRKSDKPIFVVQRHDATQEHYDLRLEVNGELASWALPKGPSLDPSDKRLAVRVEDHPLDYADFEGVIPEEQYGAGPVIVWDRGTWECEESDAAEGIKAGKLSFRVVGEKLSGAWTLTRMNGRSSDNKDDWLLIKQNDAMAKRGGKPITEREPHSVKTGRTIKEVAEGKDAGANRLAPEDADTPHREPPRPSQLSSSKKNPMPKEIKPELCTLADAAPEGDEWLHEIKFDGYRLIARKDADNVQLLSRNQKDWTKRLSPIAKAIGKLGAKRLILDGEAAILDRQGRTSFQRLQQSIKDRDFAQLVFYVFDLLYFDGYDLTDAKLGDRKAMLRDLLGEASDGVLRYSDHVLGKGPDVYENACEMGLEGIISKRVDAAYRQTRSKAWLKVKCSKRQELVIVGWTPPSGSRKHFGSLLLGVHNAQGQLVPAGRVGTGFSDRTLKEIKAKLDRLARKTCPLDIEPTRAEQASARWVTPKLVAEIEFTEWTDDGRLRHPSFQGLREDKDPEDVVLEQARPKDRAERDAEEETRRATDSKPGGSRSSRGEARVAGVRLTSVDRVLYPEQGLTKLDLAEHYERVAERMLPLVASRPLSLVRCPQGRRQDCFFQKHPGQTFGDSPRRIKVQEKNATREYVLVDELSDLVSLVQFGVLEIHPWGSAEDDLEKPDRLVFDLDPGDGATLDQIKQGAEVIRDRLDDLTLKSFLLATGGQGLHVIVPVKPDASWDDARAFCQAIAKGVASAEPEKYVAVSTKSKRKNKVFVDYLRNSRGATAIAPYSTRARPNAPVATPLSWDELANLESPSQYTVANLPRRLAALKRDPWDGYRRTRQRLTKRRVEKATS
jgi:bifunctional non-homologous end joining protein LigD